MAKLLFDSHAHIDDAAYDEDREAFYAGLADSDLAFVVNVGADLASSRRAAENARRMDFVYAAVGVHPAEIGELSEAAMDELRQLARLPKVQAIGEIGLDYHYEDNPPREEQRYWFRRQIDLALELDMPICIHSRDADQDTMDVLRASGAFGRIGVLLHCYSGSAELARQYAALGAYFSVAGPVTYKNNRKTAEVVAQADLSRLLIETDSPYLTPVPLRGKRNDPRYVAHVARRVAEIRGISYEEAARATCENACRFYRIPQPGRA